MRHFIYFRICNEIYILNVKNLLKTIENGHLYLVPCIASVMDTNRVRISSIMTSSGLELRHRNRNSLQWKLEKKGSNFSKGQLVEENQ